MGIAITLILVILLSQSRFFDFYMDTYLGRMILLAFIIFVAYTNKILGLFAVLAIIVAFNYNEMNVVQSYNYFEGFENSTPNAANNDKKDEHKKIKEHRKKIEEHRKKIEEHRKKLKQHKKENEKKTSQEGREGFCMSDRETNILRGKQSNSVPVLNDARTQLDDVSPTDKSIFSSSFASF